MSVSTISRITWQSWILLCLILAILVLMAERRFPDITNTIEINPNAELSTSPTLVLPACTYSRGGGDSKDAEGSTREIHLR